MKPIYLAPTVESRIIVGIISFTAMIIVIGWVAINEDARMQEFTERSEGRAIELGATLFESNCASCHGYQGLGSTQAPALNSPHMFGFNYYEDIDDQIRTVRAQMSSAAPEEMAELETREATLFAERLILEETILYDWSAEIEELTVQVNAVNEEIAALGIEGVANGSRLAGHISSLEINMAPMLQERDDLQSRVDEAEDPETALSAEEEERLAELEADIEAADADIEPLRELADRHSELSDQLTRFQAVQAAQEQVVELRTTIAADEGDLAALGEAPEEGADPNAVEREELETAIIDAQGSLETAIADRETAFEALIENRDIQDYRQYVVFNPFPDDPEASPDPVPSRVQQTQWTGTLFDYVHGTLVGGRPTSASYWPQPMAPWIQPSGPLRPDQIRYLTEFILNWDREFTIADIRAVNQFAKVPQEGGAVAMDSEGVGTDVAAISEQLATMEAEGFVRDASMGENLFVTYACSGCHGAQAGTGPALAGLWTRVVDNEEGRLTDSGFEDNPEQYLIHSIVRPNAYLVPGYGENIMPATFGDTMSIEDLGHILAYLEEQD